LAKNAGEVGLNALACVVMMNLPCTRLLFCGLCCELQHSDVLVYSSLLDHMHDAQYHLDLKKSPFPYSKLGVPS
jgi:hypothetical protein